MTEFLDDDFAGNRRRMRGALSADKGGILDRTGCNEGCKVAKPACCKDRDAMIDTETGSRYREKAAPSREYDGLGFAMMRASIEPGCDTTREDFQLAATSAKCGAVIKHKDIRARRGSAMPVTIRGGIFLGRVLGRGGLPFPEFDTESGIQVRDRGARSIVSPEFHNGSYPHPDHAARRASVGGPAFGARGFVENHKRN